MQLYFDGSWLSRLGVSALLSTGSECPASIPPHTKVANKAPLHTFDLERIELERPVEDAYLGTFVI
jgi:hypothetical protein